MLFSLLLFKGFVHLAVMRDFQFPSLLSGPFYFGFTYLTFLDNKIILSFYFSCLPI